tara:strand:- start:463 stop:579 length:117 start_codon:yes stop_codon:yes gene_type:complete
MMGSLKPHADVHGMFSREYDEGFIGPKDFKVLWLTGSI